MATKKEILEQAQQAVADFFMLSKQLLGDDAPLDINEILEGDPLYEPAKEMADILEIDWDNMTRSESNRIVINLLADYFCKIQPDPAYKLCLSVSCQKVS